MSYVKTTWANGDTITAEKLNHAEDGIAAAQPNPLVVLYEAVLGEQGAVTATTTTPIADVLDALQANKEVKFRMIAEGLSATVALNLASYDVTPGDQTVITSGICVTGTATVYATLIQTSLEVSGQMTPMP